MDTKPWYQSKTIWGVVVAFLAQILKGRGVDIAPESPQLVDGILNAIAFASAIFAIYGRVRAAKLIAPKPDDSTVAGGPRLPLIAILCLPFSILVFSLGGCSTTQVAKSPAGAAVITKVSNSVIDKGLNAGATRLDTGNPFLHSLADGLRSVEGQVLTSDDVKKIAANFGDPSNKSKFTTLALDVWNVIQDAALKIGWTAATELAAQTLQSAAVNPAPASP